MSDVDGLDNGPYATREEGEKAVAILNANRCPCGGIDLHRVDWTGQHWDRERGKWR